MLLFNKDTTSCFFSFACSKWLQQRNIRHRQNMQAFMDSTDHSLDQRRRCSVLIPSPFYDPFFGKCMWLVVRRRSALKRSIDRPYQRADTGTWGVQCNLCLSDVTFVPSSCSSAHYRPSSSTETVLSASRLSCLTVILFSPQPHSLLPPSLLLPVFCRQLLTCLSSTQPPWLVFMTTGAYLSQWNAVAFWDVAAVPR